jgi:hypothetical protein
MQFNGTTTKLSRRAVDRLNNLMWQIKAMEGALPGAGVTAFFGL